MKKVILNFNPVDGSVTDNSGFYLSTNTSLSYDEVIDSVKSEINVSEIVKLKDAGFTVEEIVTMRDRGLV